MRPPVLSDAHFDEFSVNFACRTVQFAEQRVRLAWAECIGIERAQALEQRVTARIGIEQQLAQALASAPENAGPLNSHRLVLRALERMRDLAPDYLHRFIVYADALCWLEDAERGMAAAQAAAGERKRASPARTRR